VSSVLAEGDDKLLSLSDDGKVKRWNTRSGKCLAEVLLAVKSCICAVKEP
jgi:WD40 repeat protein